MLILIAASIPAFITEARLSNQSFRLNSWRAPEARRLNYLEWILTRDSHVKEVKLFALGRLILGRYRALFEKFYREDRALAQKRFVYGLVLTLLSLGAFYACYAFVARRAALGGMTLGDLTLYVLVFRQGQSAFQSMLGGVAGLYEDALVHVEPVRVPGPAHDPGARTPVTSARRACRRRRPASAMPPASVPDLAAPRAARDRAARRLVPLPGQGELGAARREPHHRARRDDRAGAARTAPASRR